MEGLLEEVRSAFGGQLRAEHLLELSRKLQVELKKHLITSPQCMLPSYNYVLPTGKEHGTYLALEVGGSTLRVALVDLDGKRGVDSLGLRRIETYAIPREIRLLRGLEFFDWIAARIADMLAVDKCAQNHRPNPEPLHMGIAWAFPIEYVSSHTWVVISVDQALVKHRSARAKYWAWVKDLSARKQ